MTLWLPNILAQGPAGLLGRRGGGSSGMELPTPDLARGCCGMPAPGR